MYDIKKTFLFYILLSDDYRVLIKQARVECQSHKLTVEDPVTLEYITRYLFSLRKLQRDLGGGQEFFIERLP